MKMVDKLAASVSELKNSVQAFSVSHTVNKGRERESGDYGVEDVDSLRNTAQILDWMAGELANIASDIECDVHRG